MVSSTPFQYIHAYFVKFIHASNHYSYDCEWKVAWNCYVRRNGWRSHPIGLVDVKVEQHNDCYLLEMRSKLAKKKMLLLRTLLHTHSPLYESSTKPKEFVNDHEILVFCVVNFRWSYTTLLLEKCFNRR